MTDRMRQAEFERGEVDARTGSFPMSLATDGEASDGDILSIEGAEFPERVSLQIAHINDPRDTLGSASGFRRDLQSSPKRLRAHGQIEVAGDGPLAEIRRDIAFMMAQGHISGISVRWKPIKTTRRMDLPPDHPAHVKQGDRDARKRSGVFHEKWRVLEATVVPVQADLQAMTGRASETEGPVSAFWRAMAADIEQREAAIEAESADIEPEAIEPEAAEAAVTEVFAPTREDRLWALSQAVNALEADGLSIDDIRNTLDEMRAPEPTPVERALREQVSSLELRLAALEEGRVTDTEPAPVFQSVKEIQDYTDQQIARMKRDGLLAVKAALDTRRGKLTPSGSLRDQTRAEVDALITEAYASEQISATDAERMKSLLAGFEELVDDARKRLATADAQE